MKTLLIKTISALTLCALLLPAVSLRTTLPEASLPADGSPSPCGHRDNPGKEISASVSSHGPRPKGKSAESPANKPEPASAEYSVYNGQEKNSRLDGGGKKQTDCCAAGDDVVYAHEFLMEYIKAELSGGEITSGLIETGAPYPEFVYYYTDEENVTRCFFLGMYWDEENGRIIGRSEKGAFGFGFDVDTKQRLMYSALNGWERSLGYNGLFDTLAPAAGIFFDTKRFRFEHDGIDWMVQIWKGNYFIGFPGAEIGVYNKPVDRVAEHYDAALDNQMPSLSMRLLNKDGVLFEMDERKHWWMSGVTLNGAFAPRGELALEGSILFESQDMMAAFLEAFDEQADTGSLKRETDGLRVRFVWSGG